MNTAAARTLLALALETAALVALGLALAGGAWLDARSQPRLLVLVDRSQSVPRADSDRALAGVLGAARSAGAAEPQLIEFAGRPAPPSVRPADSAATLQPAATDIEAALQAALAAHARAPVDRLVVISDGLDNLGDTARGLRAVHEAGLPLQWIAVGRPPPETRIAEVLAPERARLGGRARLTVQLAGRLDRPLRLAARVQNPGGDPQASSGQPGADGQVTIEFDTGRGGALRLDLALLDTTTGQTLDAWPDAAVIDVTAPATLLYAQGSPGALADSLQRGGWSLQRVPAAQLDRQAEALDAYQAVVLDDIAIDDAGPRFWQALVTAVQTRGLGLVVLGGERSFARGGYRGSLLETVLPLASEPAALDQPAAIVFAVDKSGSMGQGSGGIDRFALAQRAVIETARGLGARDALGLLAFDSVPRVLIPLGPAAAGNAALARDWQASPNGGTRLVPAIESAIEQLDHAGAARRLLVLVTDGFIDEAPLAEVRAHLARSRIETVALAVGPDADVVALQRLVGSAAGTVLRVDQAAELPRLMRAGLERRRARIERGSLTVEQRLPLPFAPGRLEAWPAISAHAVTRPQPQATVVLQTARGEPLLAYQWSGRGRVVALSCGLGPWTAGWLQWPQWPRLAGGLADWVSASPPGGALALAVSDLANGLQVEAELPVGPDPPDAGAVSLTVDTPTTPGRALAVDRFAPGRLRATLPDDGPGLYTVVAASPQGTRRQLHLRRQRAENVAWGLQPALPAWTAAGLIGPWDPALPARHGTGRAEAGMVDRSLVALALALFLCGVGVDRGAWLGAGLRRRARG